MPTDLAKTAAELRALMAKATPGPWTLEGKELRRWVGGISTNPAIPSPDVVATPSMSDRYGSEDDNNMSLIVAAINALPELLAAAERAPVDVWDGHASDCATHNEPASPNGPCDCGAAPAAPADVDYGGLIARLRERACHALEEGTATAQGDARHFNEAATALERQAAQISALTAERDTARSRMRDYITQAEPAESALAAAREENARLQTALDAATESNRRIYVALTAEREKNGTEMPGADDYEEAAHD